MKRAIFFAVGLLLSYLLILSAFAVVDPNQVPTTVPQIEDSLIAPPPEGADPQEKVEIEKLIERQKRGEEIPPAPTSPAPTPAPQNDDLAPLPDDAFKLPPPQYGDSPQMTDTSGELKQGAPVIPIKLEPKKKINEKLLTGIQIVLLVILAVLFVLMVRYFIRVSKLKETNQFLMETAKKIALDIISTGKFAVESLSISEIAFGENSYVINSEPEKPLPADLAFLTLAGANPIRFETSGKPVGGNGIILEFGTPGNSVAIVVDGKTGEVEISKNYEKAYQIFTASIERIED